jgi:hypothetical protein
MQEMHKVTPLIMVVQHTFGRHLNFNTHLHLMVSAGGLRESDGRWIAPRHLNRNAIMRVWREAVTTYLSRALNANLFMVRSGTRRSPQDSYFAIRALVGCPYRPTHFEESFFAIRSSVYSTASNCSTPL